MAASRRPASLPAAGAGGVRPSAALQRLWDRRGRRFCPPASHRPGWLSGARDDSPLHSPSCARVSLYHIPLPRLCSRMLASPFFDGLLPLLFSIPPALQSATLALRVLPRVWMKAQVPRNGNGRGWVKKWHPKFTSMFFWGPLILLSSLDFVALALSLATSSRRIFTQPL